MTNAQKSEVIIAICGLLKETTQKRLVVQTGDLVKDVPVVRSYQDEGITNKEVIDRFLRSSTTFQQTKVEYYNTIFSQEEVNTLKRKLLKLTQEL